MNYVKTNQCHFSPGFGSKKTNYSLQPQQSKIGLRLLALGNSEKTVKTLKAIANPERLLILFFLAEGDNSVSQISSSLSIKQVKLSNQLMVLKAANLVSARRLGKEIIYALKDQKIKEFIVDLMQSNLITGLSEKDTCKTFVSNK